jgi:formylglycine-generating enzyme required for sulfatase activity
MILWFKEHTMPDTNNSSVQANNNSVGNLSVGGSVEGSITIGNHNVVGFTSDQVSVLITQISTTFQVKPFDGRCPYKGLDVFDEEDAELFFGREKLIEDLVNRVKESRTIFITGPSGSGKSSLVRAGLIHKLKQAGIQESHSEGWLYATIKPGREPINALGSAVASLVMSTNAEDEIRAKALTDETIFARWCEIALKDGHNKRIVLFIDQFEEVFTQIGKEEERAAFLNLLTHAAQVENGRAIILFSMRSDFLPNCATYPRLNSLLNQQFIQIGAMQPNELVSAIAQPALRVGLRIDPDLIAQIINDMKGEPGSLPLMQFALQDLFRAQQAKGDMIALLLNDYLQRGGIQKSLERHADTAFSELNEHEQELARIIFTGLIEIGRGTVDTRRTALSNELIPTSAQAGDVKTVVQKLANARLITTDAVTVTISHERLIDAWPWLKKLVNENRDVIALKNEIATDAKEWDEHQRDASYLYTGARLANAREKMEVKKLTLSGLAQSFVDAGIQMEESKRQEEEKRRQKELEDARKLAATERRARLITNGVLAATVILIGVLSYAPIRNEIWRQQAKGLDLIIIPKSEVIIGNELNADGRNSFFLPPDKKVIEAFNIEPYEVTNERYMLCVKAGKCSVPLESTLIYNDLKNAKLPVVTITAIQASQFCEWLDRQLPTELEWERAARFTDGRPWPWGFQIPTDEFASFYNATNISLRPVGQYESGISEEGVYDLAGNVWEWTRSAYDFDHPDWENSTSEPPISLSVKGGDFQTKPETAMSGTIAYRYEAGPYFGDSARGFRCVSH